MLPVDDEALDVRPIGRDEVLYASARLRRVKQPATIETSRRCRWCSRSRRTASAIRRRRQLAARAQVAGLSIEPAIEVEDLETAVDIASRGLADTVISSAIAAGRRFRAGLGVVSFADPFFETFAIVTRRQTVLSPAVTALLRVAERRLAARQAGPEPRVR